MSHDPTITTAATTTNGNSPRDSTAITTAAVRNPKPTPSQAEETMRCVIRKTHEVLSHALSYKYAGIGDPACDAEALTGCCGLAQSFIYHTLKDKGIVSKPVALQTLPGSASFPHVTLTAEVDTTDGTKVYLLDKTFQQFCKGKDGEPGQVLGRMAEGKDLLDALCKEGFVELTPVRASSYLAAFNGGCLPFATEKKTMNFFANPISSKMNLWFSRDDMERWGYIGNPAVPSLRQRRSLAPTP